MNDSLFKTVKFRRAVRTLTLSVSTIIAASFLSTHGHAAENDNHLDSEERMILDAQPLQLLSTARALQKADDSIRMEISAFDEVFSLKLSRNEKLTKNIPMADSDIELFKGKIEGNDASWVRLTRLNGVITGAIYDGNELFIIDKTKTVEDDLAPWLKESLQGNTAQANARTKTSAPASIIYKLTDTVDSATCGMQDTTSNSRNRYQNLIRELRGLRYKSNPTALAAAADQQVNIVIVADTQYVASSNGNVNGQVLSQMNVVDGIFSEQVNVQFNIEQIIPLSNNGPLTSTDPSGLLNAFRSYINSNVGNPGLAHLFSGKNLNGSTIGIAYLRALCTSNGVGVTQAGGRGITGALTAAHEFGHNFGAPHDNQGGSACSNSPRGFLMNPSINGSDQFSQCSLSQIAPVVARARCLVPADGPTPTPTPTPLPTPDCKPGALDLRNVEAYSGNNTGNFSVSRDGCSMTLNGNIWRITETGVDITADTKVSFDFTARGTAEIQGVGFDADNGASANRIFQLAGTQNWGIRDFAYTGNGQTQSFTIPVGEFYSGVNLGFVIANDKDSGTPNNSVTVSNVVFSNDTPPASCISLENVSPFSSTNSGQFSANGCRIDLSGNIWRVTSETFDITPTSVLSFDFSTNGNGEIHGIGFDNDLTPTRNRIFQLDGSQNWGIRDFNYTGGTQRFEIPVGQYYTGSSLRLVLVNDKDSGSANNQSTISNVKLTN